VLNQIWEKFMNRLEGELRRIKVKDIMCVGCFTIFEHKWVLPILE
jgi:hypothetical protein